MNLHRVREGHVVVVKKHRGFKKRGPRQPDFSASPDFERAKVSCPPQKKQTSGMRGKLWVCEKVRYSLQSPFIGASNDMFYVQEVETSHV